jgi:hypothetical protein
LLLLPPGNNAAAAVPSERSQRFLSLLLALLKQVGSRGSTSLGSSGSGGRVLFVATSSAALEALQAAGISPGSGGGLEWAVRVPGLCRTEVAGGASPLPGGFDARFPRDETPVGHLRAELELALASSSKLPPAK